MSVMRTYKRLVWITGVSMLLILPFLYLATDGLHAFGLGAGLAPKPSGSPADPDFLPENAQPINLEVTQGGVTARLVAGRFTPARTTVWFTLTHPTITEEGGGVSLFTFPPHALEVSGFQQAEAAPPKGRWGAKRGVEGYEVHLGPVVDPAQPVSISIKELLVRKVAGEWGNDIVTGPWAFTLTPGTYTADEEAPRTKIIGKAIENQGIRIEVQSIQIRGSEVEVRYTFRNQSAGTIEPLGRPQLSTSNREHPGSGPSLPKAGDVGSAVFNVPSGTQRATLSFGPYLSVNTSPSVQSSTIVVPLPETRPTSGEVPVGATIMADGGQYHIRALNLNPHSLSVLVEPLDAVARTRPLTGSGATAEDDKGNRYTLSDMSTDYAPSAGQLQLVRQALVFEPQLDATARQLRITAQSGMLVYGPWNLDIDLNP